MLWHSELFVNSKENVLAADVTGNMTYYFSENHVSSVDEKKKKANDYTLSHLSSHFRENSTLELNSLP